jgi:hypothetical protein
VKPPIKPYRLAALAGVALMLAGCAILPIGQHTQTNAANRVSAAYQVSDLLAEAAPAVSQSLKKNLPKTISTAQRNRLRRIVANAYATQTLRRGVVERLKRKATQTQHAKQLAAAADTLEKPLVQHMIRLERNVTQPDFRQGFKAFVKQPTGARRKRRLTIVRQIAAHMQVVALQTGFNITLLASMIRARNAVGGKNARMSNAQIKRILSNTRTAISAKLRQRVPLMLLYVYRNVDTRTLQQYADLQAQPAMIWTNRALAQAIVNTLATASQSIPQQFRSPS